MTAASWDECECVHYRAAHDAAGRCRRTLVDWDGEADWECPCQVFRPRQAPRIAGAIGRGLVDAAAAYKRSLEALEPPTVQR